MFEAVIFDLDGVVVDTAKYHYLAWKRLANRLGYDLREEDNEKFKGVDRIRCMELLASLAGLCLSRQEVARLAELKNKWYAGYISNMNTSELLPGFMEFITDVRKSGSKTALASTSKNTGIILDRLDIRQLFDAVVDGNAVQRSKPDPQVFEISAELLGADREGCVVLEDAQAGIDAAKAAKMVCVGVGNPMVLSGADVVVSGFNDPALRLFMSRHGRNAYEKT